MRNILSATILRCAIVIAFVVSASVSEAQDAHFSQYYMTPLTVNPALTGVFDGKFRVSNDYRTQWTGIGSGYKTLHVSADLPLAKGMLGSNYFGLGFLLVQDKAGEAGYAKTNMMASLSYVAALDDQGDNFVSIGFQGGINSQSLDLSKATWDNQWNGDAFDPYINSFESIQLETFSYLDFNAGLMYYYVPDGANTFNVGASMSHIGSPNVSFFTLSDAPLYQKFTFHSSGEFTLNRDKYAWICPKVFYQQQGPHQEALFGAYFKNKIQFKSRYTNYKKEAYFYLGGFYRWKDATIIGARIEYNMFGLGLSYDINSSQLGNLASGANAFEITLSYVSYVKRGQHSKHFNKMPRFF